MRFLIASLTVALSMVAMQSRAASPERTASSGDDPFIAYNLAMTELLRIGGCSQFYANRGDKEDARLLDQIGAQVNDNRDAVLFLTRFKPWLARAVAAQGKPNPEEVAAFTERMLRDKARSDLAQNITRDEVGFQKTCDAVRSRASHGDIPLSTVGNDFPVTLSLLRSVR